MKKQLAKLIYKARKEQGITQLEAAFQTKIGLPTYINVEQGRGNVGINTYEKVIKFFNLKIELR